MTTVYLYSNFTRSHKELLMLLQQNIHHFILLSLLGKIEYHRANTFILWAQRDIVVFSNMQYSTYLSEWYLEQFLRNCPQLKSNGPDQQSTLVHVMSWCRQATIHSLNQCWSRSMSPYNATRPHYFHKCLSTWLATTLAQAGGAITRFDITW